MKPTECIKTEIEHQYPVSLIQTGLDRFTVVYGKQEIADLSYAQVADEYGSCVMHALACAGRLDNRDRRGK